MKALQFTTLNYLNIIDKEGKVFKAKRQAIRNGVSEIFEVGGRKYRIKKLN